MTMKPESLSGYHFTFLHGARVRSGSNYLGKIMGLNPAIQQVPLGKTTVEFQILMDLDLWSDAFDEFVRRYLGDKDVFEFPRFLPHLGSAWLAYVIETFSLQPGHVFVKSSNVRHIDKFFAMFPEARLIILVRDGRDNVASSVKAALAVRRHKTFVQNSKTRLNNFLHRDFRAAARDWSNAVDRILRFDEEFKGSPFASRYRILRYEDVFREPRQMAERIFEFMQVPCDSGILDAVENAEVVGSSFYSSSKREDARKPNWVATPRTEAFQPIGRWRRWSTFQKNLFKRIAGEALIRMGYEEGPNWT